VGGNNHVLGDKKLFHEVAMSTIGLLAIWAIGVVTGAVLVIYANELARWGEVILAAASCVLALMIALATYRGGVNRPRHS
jgi:hypothetical protein